MLLVSTGKSTILSDFADLETISTYGHQNAEATDFQFYPGSNIFVEVNKKSGLEIMRIKDKNGTGKFIQKLLQLKIENAYCVGCAHQSFKEITLGLSNGQVWVYDYRKTEMLHRFAGEKMNSVVYVDYNAGDDYIAGTHENGLINIYGNKTRAKMETINIDSQPLLSRFHPTKRFHLSIASQKGAVTVYDVGAKRRVFNSTDAHSAPCRDCAWSLASPDTLLSVGYDCVINIFDTRRKVSPIKLIQKYPLSTVALSGCGQYFCVGNLKGELSTYDMRNTKTELCLKKVHDGAVNRVAFVPDYEKTNGQDISSETVSTNPTEETNTSELAYSDVQRMDSNERRRSFVTARGQRDSFCDFMDFHSKKGAEKTSSRLTAMGSRDSFDWENLPRKKSWTNRGSVAFTGSNLSPIESDPNNESKDDKTDEVNNVQALTQKPSLKQPSTELPLRERNFSSPAATAEKKLVQINEEPYERAYSQNSSNYDKENRKSLLELQQPGNSSTPITVAHQAKLSSSPKSINEVVKEIKDLREDMDARFKNLETELKFEAERNKWQIFSQANNLYCKQFESLEDIRGAMLFLVQTDPFVQEFTRLKEENRQLKEQLERVMRKK